MFRHIVLFRFKDDADAARISEVLDGLQELPEQIETIRSYSVQRDAEMSDGNHDACIVAVFDDPEGFLTYRDHPLHVEHAKERLGPLIAERAAIQVAD